MALNIPMPDLPGTGFLKGIDTGSTMFSRMIQPVLEREKQRQQAEQFAQDLALRKQALAKQGANSDLHRQLLEQQILAAQHANDPMYEFNQFKNLMGMMGGSGQMGGQGGGQLPPMPTQEMGQDMGMFSPQGLAEAQTAVPQAQLEGGAGPFEALKTNPMLRGFFKRKFGFDPLAPAPETPEEKQNSALDLFKKKEEYKSSKEKELPAAIKTLHENIIHLSPKAVDAIQHIIDIPSPFDPWGFGAIKSGQKAAHNKSVTAASENYAKAKGWPNTKGSIEKAESILQRGKFETDFDYRKRLREYQDELNRGIQLSNQFLHPGKQNSSMENKSNDPLGIR